jgi:hypothetical protein
MLFILGMFLGRPNGFNGSERRVHGFALLCFLSESTEEKYENDRFPKKNDGVVISDATQRDGSTNSSKEITQTKIPYVWKVWKCLFSCKRTVPCSWLAIERAGSRGARRIFVAMNPISESRCVSTLCDQRCNSSLPRETQLELFLKKVWLLLITMTSEQANSSVNSDTHAHALFLRFLARGDYNHFICRVVVCANLKKSSAVVVSLVDSASEAAISISRDKISGLAYSTGSFYRIAS